MILLSALLASLTGLVAGERPAERAQVELSAVAAIVQPGKAVVHRAGRPAVAKPVLVRAQMKTTPLMAVAPIFAPRARLSLKQSWLN